MKTITLTVFFEGTIYSIEQRNSHLYHFFHEDCEGQRIRSPLDLVQFPQLTHFKMGFDGCGVAFGLPGLLFGSGLDSQYNVVESVVKALIKSGAQVKLNCIGLSRGGVACLLLAKKLGAIDLAHLETKLLLLDPVPGNSLLAARKDFFSKTLANQAMDVSNSRNLTSVHTIYPYQEAGDDYPGLDDKVVALMQIPIRPTYPPQCVVNEEVIIGAHLNAFQDESTAAEQVHALHGVDSVPIIRQLSKEIIGGFLQQMGALSQMGQDNIKPVIASRFQAEQVKWTTWLKSIMKDIIPKDRPFHSQDNSRLSASNTGLFLNKIHRDLVPGAEITPDNLCLKIVPERVKPIIAKTPLSKKILLDFIQVIKSQMTLYAQLNKKSKLADKIANDLQEKSFTEEELSFVLRDILALQLQQESYSAWFFSPISWNDVVMNKLNTSEFAPIRLCIRPDGNPVKMTDLRCYVLGKDVPSYFAPQNENENLSALEQTPTGTDRYPSLI
ncbi:MAG: hypothetical protein EPN84_06095 [Legionella sp.]|nr:MAG: hypothetical protein EPN84_06095 [Legionella sp.]